jgi:hypothetical protein
MEDAPFMVMLSVILLTFVTVLGLFISENFISMQKQAQAVDSAEKIFNSADLLSAGAVGSTRTIWVDLPDGYSIDFSVGNVSLKGKGNPVGNMGLEGVRFFGDSLTGGKKYHLLLEFTVDGFGNSKISVSEIP